MKRFSFIQAGLVLALSGAGMAHAVTELVVATVNNGHMIEMQKLTPVNRRFLEIKGMTRTEFRRQADGRFGRSP